MPAAPMPQAGMCPPRLSAPIDRRRLLGLAGAGLAGLLAPALAFAGKDDDGFILVRARPGKAALKAPWGPPTDIWSYEGTAPGPEIRITRGDELRLRLINDLPQPTSIHWHGVRTPNAMDGVPGLTQQAIAPAGSSTMSLPRPMPAPSGITPTSRPTSRSPAVFMES